MDGILRWVFTCFILVLMKTLAEVLNVIPQLKLSSWFFSVSTQVLSHLLLFAQTPFGYSRKDVLLIGLGVTVLGVGLKSGLEVP